MSHGAVAASAAQGELAVAVGICIGAGVEPELSPRARLAITSIGAPRARPCGVQRRRRPTTEQAYEQSDDGAPEPSQSVHSRVQYNMCVIVVP